MKLPALRWIVLMLFLLGMNKAWSEQTWTLNFKDAELEELVRFVADATGKTVVLDPKTRGRVQVVSSQPVTQRELYDLFLTILEVNGFTAVEAGNVVKVVPLRDARAAGGPVVGDDRRPNDEVVTQVIQLQNVSAAKMIPVLRPLAPQQAHMAAYGPANAIIVSDSAANVARLRELIRDIDGSAVSATEVVRLDHAAADEAVKLLNQLQRTSGGEQAGADVQPASLMADRRTNSVFIKGDDMQRARVRTLLRHLDAPQAQVGNVRVVYLQYAKAALMAEVLNRVVQNVDQLTVTTGEGGAPNVSIGGAGPGNASIEADEQTNSLIITADAELMASLNGVIERLDIRRAQVLVEAIIVEIRGSKGRDLGVQWLFTNDSGAYGGSSLGDELLGVTTAVTAGLDGKGDPIDPQVGLGDVLGSARGQILGIGRLGSDFSFNVVLSALQTDSDANILSTPSLLTLDNEEATIMVGENVPFVTGSYTTPGATGSLTSPFQTVQRENVGLTLRVTPHINEGDSLVLELEQEVSSLTTRAAVVNAADVITQERKIQTKVLAENGQTIVLGGLVQDNIIESAQRVPVLGSLPLVGRLFRSTSVSKEKTHLMVFIRPLIVRDERTLLGATAEKYGLTRDLQRARLGDQGFLSDDELPMLPAWEAEMLELDELRSERSGAVFDLRSDQPGAVQSAPGAER